MPTTTTENLALAAYALSEGAELRRIRVSRANGRRTAVFEIESAAMESLSGAFYDSSAVVNLARYRDQVSRLKDALCDALRVTETETRTDTETQDRDRRPHDPHRQGRARAPQGAR